MNDHQQALNFWPDATTVGGVLEKIRNESRDEQEKGRWFENLTARLLVRLREFEVDAVWRWAEWPEREAVTGLSGQDIGIDLIARRTNGELIAVQCKCHNAGHRIGLRELSTFLTVSSRKIFPLRWIIATAPLSRNSRDGMKSLEPPVQVIDFLNYLNEEAPVEIRERQHRQPLPLQKQAIEHVCAGLLNHDRGRLVMACGTGKTFTALRVTETIVPDGGRILFLAPSIALVSQARREWLRHTVWPREDTRSLVICSDRTAGGRGEEDIGLNELECPVTTDPAEIAKSLKDGAGKLQFVFCTYQSLPQVIQAQQTHGAPTFDFTVADEAHRTTGVEGSLFTWVHDRDKLQSHKRLYMTATPRIYTEASKARLRKRDKPIEIHDMSSLETYGPEFHRLSFRDAVDESILCDYQVVVLGVRNDQVSDGLKRTLVEMADNWGGGVRTNVLMRSRDVSSIVGTALAINGVWKNYQDAAPLHKTIAFANTVERSKFFAKALGHSQLQGVMTRRRRGINQEADKLPVRSQHVDARSSAQKRNQALRDLDNAAAEGELHVISNVRLFTEGVDVPSLNAVAFMEPRESQIDVVQAVGRVMRTAEGKRRGYIILPIPAEPGETVLESVRKSGSEEYKTVGKVLRALLSHDTRLLEEPERFILFGETDGGNGTNPAEELEQLRLNLVDVTEGLYAHVIDAIQLGTPGRRTADDIAYAVTSSGATLHEAELGTVLGEALSISGDGENEKHSKNVCIIAALLLANACLLHRRLLSVPALRDLPGMRELNGIGGEADVVGAVQAVWLCIIERDYVPVFEPALAVLEVLPRPGEVGYQASRLVLTRLAEFANASAESLSELGYDHAGPLYHRILPTAQSDGAYYTSNLTALMLARLALDDNFADWEDLDAVRKLRIMDPACGTGTLLMAAMKTIKERTVKAGVSSVEVTANLHRKLVESVLCGLDINRHAVQLAACNLTLGAPTVDYQRMNLHTLQHGPQPNGDVRVGSLEILNTVEDQNSIQSLVRPLRTLTGLESKQVDNATETEFPMANLDLVIMNPPFTEIVNQAGKFHDAVKKQMQRRQVAIRDDLAKLNPARGKAINHRSVRTFFTPLADMLIDSNKGTLAQVLPATACIGAAGLNERLFLAKRFHIERIVTSHDPTQVNFSENTDIHECLLVCRRHAEEKPSTQFVAIRRMPKNADEAVAVAEAIASREFGEWASACEWPRESVKKGNWSPVQWMDPKLPSAVQFIESSECLEQVELQHHIGPTGQVVRVNFQAAPANSEGAVPVFYSVSAKLRRTMRGDPEGWYAAKDGKEELAKRYWNQRSHFLVAQRYDTISGRLTGLWSSQPSIGSGWVPVKVDSEDRAKALAAWWNSTPVRLMLLNRRSKKLTYPAWSLSQLREIQVPKTDDAHAWDALSKAFRLTCDREMLPLKQAQECRVREVIDEAAAVALCVDVQEIAEWRKSLSKEPTITNTRADSS